MVNGDGGPAQALAMSILVRMADVYGAAELMDISQAHIDSTIYLGDATLEFAERLPSLGAEGAGAATPNLTGRDAGGRGPPPASTSAASTSAAGRIGRSNGSGRQKPRARCSPTSGWGRCRRGPARPTPPTPV